MLEQLEQLTYGTQVNRQALYLLKHLSTGSSKNYSSHRVGNLQNRKWGSGLEFDQLREYTSGDDPRFIDWKASSRHSTVYSKQFIEDKDANCLIVIDLQDAMFFGSTKRLLSALACYLACLLCWNWHIRGYAVAFHLINSRNKIDLPLTHKEPQLRQSLDHIARMHNSLHNERHKPALAMHLKPKQWRHFEQLCIITNVLSIDSQFVKTLTHNKYNRKRVVMAVEDPLFWKLHKLHWISDGHSSVQGVDLRGKVHNNAIDALKQSGIDYQRFSTDQSIHTIANRIRTSY